MVVAGILAAVAVPPSVVFVELDGGEALDVSVDHAEVGLAAVSGSGEGGGVRFAGGSGGYAGQLILDNIELHHNQAVWGGGLWVGPGGEVSGQTVDIHDNTASKYGGEDFALVFGGNEMAGYHTGPTFPVSLAVGCRHSHLDSAGYSYDQKTAGKKELTPEDIADYVIREERWRQILCSLVICLFARGIYKPDLVVEAFKPLGLEYTEDDLRELGKKIHLLKLKYKIEEGFRLDEIKFPKRIFETPTPHGMIKPEVLEKAVALFRERVLGELKQAA